MELFVLAAWPRKTARWRLAPAAVSMNLSCDSCEGRERETELYAL